MMTGLNWSFPHFPSMFFFYKAFFRAYYFHIATVLVQTHSLNISTNICLFYAWEKKSFILYRKSIFFRQFIKIMFVHNEKGLSKEKKGHL